MLKTMIAGVCLIVAPSALAKVYDCRTDYSVGDRSVFEKQFVIDSAAPLDDGGGSSRKQTKLEFEHAGKRFSVDCGAIDQPDDRDTLTCGLSAWNDQRKKWSTESRGATEV